MARWVDSEGSYKGNRVSAIVSFVLRQRGIMRDRIVKKLGSVVKTEKRSSCAEERKNFVFGGDLCDLLGEQSDLCSQLLFTVKNCANVFLW